jgi:5'-3' exonuclease
MDAAEAASGRDRREARGVSWGRETVVGMLMLIDAASLWYRAYYGLPSSIKAPDGRRSGAVRGFFDGLAVLARKYSPTGMVCCLEGNWRPQWRLDLMPGYKMDRALPDGSEDTPEGLEAQVAAIEALLPALGVATAAHPDYEADDVIATLAARTAEPVLVVTGDRDLFQLVDDERDRKVVYLARGISKAELFDAEAVATKFGVDPRHYVDFAVLRGDPSDGLPGVKGIGAKTAVTLVNTYGGIAGLKAAAAEDGSDLPERQHKAITEAADYLERAVQVSTAVSDVEVPMVDATLPTEPKHPAAVEALAEEWGVASALKRFNEAITARVV